MLCHDAADAELWEDDPIEFIRHTYDVTTPPDWQEIFRRGWDLNDVEGMKETLFVVPSSVPRPCHRHAPRPTRR
jgi:hypothetical protein